VAVGACAIRIECPLAGEHQIENALVSVIALDRLGIPVDAIQKGIAATRWPGRLELISGRPEIVLDGAHNPAGARALAAYIEKFYSGRRIGLIYAAMRDKAVAEMTATVFPLAYEVIVTRPNQSRAVAPETIASMADHPRLRVAPNLTEALEIVRDAVPDGAIFITGSLFLVGEARALLCELP
jgi:dihydrofolate synthase/folylpolyglutamate synthase